MDGIRLTDKQLERLPGYVQYQDGELEITGHRGSKDSMVITPLVSNVIIVSFVEKPHA